MAEKKKTKLWGLWTIIDDKESAFHAAKAGGALCFYLAFCYGLEFVLLHFTGSTLFFGLVQDREDYYFTSSIDLILVGAFVWLGIRIIIKNKLGIVPWICGWTMLELIVKNFLFPGKGLFISVIVFIVIINAWRGWLNSRRYP